MCPHVYTHKVGAGSSRWEVEIFAFLFHGDGLDPCLLYNVTNLLRNLYAGQEATVRTEHGTTDWYVKAVYYHSAYLSYM